MGITPLPADPVPAVALTRAWLTLQDWAYHDLARRLGCSTSLVQAWMGGKRRPSFEFAAALERVSEGSVPVGAWADPSAVDAALSRGL